MIAARCSAKRWLAASASSTSRKLLSAVRRHAVQEAVKSVADKIRRRTDLHDDGALLVDRAFGGEPPMLAINPRQTVSEKSEQSGFANLVRGTFGMFRNPTAHEARIRLAMTKTDAEDLLTIVSLIHRRINSSHMPPRA